MQLWVLLALQLHRVMSLHKLLNQLLLQDILLPYIKLHFFLSIHYIWGFPLC